MPPLVLDAAAAVLIAAAIVAAAAWAAAWTAVAVAVDLPVLGCCCFWFLLFAAPLGSS